MRLKTCWICTLLLLIGISPLGCISGKAPKYGLSKIDLPKEKKLSAEEERAVLVQTNKLFVVGLRAEEEGDFRSAEWAYSNCINLENGKKNKYMGPPYHRLAVLTAREGQVRKSEEYFRQALELGTENPELACDFAQFLYDNDREQEAELILKNALITFPKNKKLQFFLGHSLAAQNKPIEALRHLKQSVGETRAYREIAATLRQRGDARGANHFDEKALIAERTRPQPLDNLKEELNREIAKADDPELELFNYTSKTPRVGSINQRFLALVEGERPEMGMYNGEHYIASSVPTPYTAQELMERYGVRSVHEIPYVPSSPQPRFSDIAPSPPIYSTPAYPPAVSYSNERQRIAVNPAVDPSKTSNPVAIPNPALDNPSLLLEESVQGSGIASTKTIERSPLTIPPDPVPSKNPSPGGQAPSLYENPLPVLEFGPGLESPILEEGPLKTRPDSEPTGSEMREGESYLSSAPIKVGQKSASIEPYTSLMIPNEFVLETTPQSANPTEISGQLREEVPQDSISPIFSGVAQQEQGIPSPKTGDAAEKWYGIELPAKNANVPADSPTSHTAQSTRDQINRREPSVFNNKTKEVEPIAEPVPVRSSTNASANDRKGMDVPVFSDFAVSAANETRSRKEDHTASIPGGVPPKSEPMSAKTPPEIPHPTSNAVKSPVSNESVPGIAAENERTHPQIAASDKEKLETGIFQEIPLNSVKSEPPKKVSSQNGPLITRTEIAGRILAADSNIINLGAGTDPSRTAPDRKIADRTVREETASRERETSRSGASPQPGMMEKPEVPAFAAPRQVLGHAPVLPELSTIPSQKLGENRGRFEPVFETPPPVRPLGNSAAVAAEPEFSLPKLSLNEPVVPSRSGTENSSSSPVESAPPLSQGAVKITESAGPPEFMKPSPERTSIVETERKRIVPPQRIGERPFTEKESIPAPTARLNGESRPPANSGTMNETTEIAKRESVAPRERSFFAEAPKSGEAEKAIVLNSSRTTRGFQEKSLSLNREVSQSPKTERNASRNPLSSKKAGEEERIMGNEKKNSISLQEVEEHSPLVLNAPLRDSAPNSRERSITLNSPDSMRPSLGETITLGREKREVPEKPQMEHVERLNPLRSTHIVSRDQKNAILVQEVDSFPTEIPGKNPRRLARNVRNAQNVQNPPETTIELSTGRPTRKNNSLSVQEEQDSGIVPEKDRRKTVEISPMQADPPAKVITLGSQEKGSPMSPNVRIPSSPMSFSFLD